ncbi:MAG: hypothetical protein ABR915_03105 [Thermoguttaceae bacterium]
MLEGARLGSFHMDVVKAPDPAALPFPRSSYVRYEWDGTHLRVHPGQDDKLQWSKDAIAKDGWYVTGDYSTNPPRVVVTKESTKNSRWSFVPGTLWGRYYLKNENDTGTEAWLYLKDTKKRYSVVNYYSDSHGNRLETYWEGSVYDAILSAEKKIPLIVEDVKANNGK